MSAYGVLRGPRAIVFGRGQRAGIAAAVAGLGARALVCTDARMAAQPEFAELVEQLRAAGVDALVHDRVEPELPAEGVSACAAELRAYAPDVIVGVGGGSCLDHAKLVALLLTHGGALADYYGELRVPGPVLPVVAVPTTAGTGSEVTPVAVLTDRARTLKVGISSPHLIPHTAIVDPDLSSSAPPALTAHTGADALAHCIESLCAITRDPDPGLAHTSVFVGRSALTDRYALEGIALIGRNLRRAVHDGTGRDELALGALYAGLAFGTAGTAAAHALQYPVGALTHTAHGVGVGVLLPYVMAFNRPAVDLDAVAAALGAPGDAVEAVAALLADIGIPRTLAELGVTEDQLDDIARLGMESGRLVRNNPRELTEDGCRAIARAAFAGDLVEELAT
jgi:alcohol dehydrogenase class IV